MMTVSERADERGFDVSRGIPFRMPVGAMERDETVEVCEKVMLNTGVGIFVDRYGRGGMGDKNHGHAALNLAFPNDLVDETGDVQKLRAAVGPMENSCITKPS